jgi:MFS family permease
MSESSPVVPAELSTQGRMLVLAAAFFGWMFAGMQMGIVPLIARSATIDMLGWNAAELTESQSGRVGEWFAWYICAFLMGAAVGGLIFGWLGDRIGRVKAMGYSILCYSLLTGLSYFVVSPEQLLVLRFVAALGIGGMWPNGVALAAEAWSDVSRPMLAGLIGTSANVGIWSTGAMSAAIGITPESWRWMLIVGAAPFFLGIAVLILVPESPHWLASRKRERTGPPRMPVAEVFRPPLLRLTLIGICLGTIPLLGGWGSGNWLIPWSDKVYKGDVADFKGWVVMSRSGGAILGALFGGWIANMFGRRSTYFVISLGSLAISGYIFGVMSPADGNEFLAWAFLLGLVSTVYFGWLPLYLPELFPTHARATGAGVTFNFGRILATVGVLGAGVLIRQFAGDFARVGAVTSLIYAVGMVVILFAPDTSTAKLHAEVEPETA